MALLNDHPLLYAVAGPLLALVLYYSVFRTPVIRRNGVPLRKPPGTLPLLGNGILFLQARQKLFSWFVKCQQQFGYETFQVAVPTLPPGVVINDPRNLDFIFKNEGTLISKGGFVKGMLWDLFGHGIVNADGDLWRVQRKAGLGFLNTANIRVLTEVALPQYLDDTLRFLRSHSSEAGADDGRTTPEVVVDLQAVFHELTSRIMGKMAYNMEMHADDEFTTAFDFASGATTERFQNPLWFVTEAVLGAAHLRRSLAVVKAFGRRIVSSAVADRQAQHGGSGSSSNKNGNTSSSSDSSSNSKIDEVSGSLIHSLLDSISDQDMVADAALNYLSAGRDTVAQGLTWTSYMLMKHPGVADKIRQEVQRVLQPAAQSSSMEGSKGHSLDFSRLTPSAMPYTMATFYEGLRLYPPIPFEIKQVEADALTLPDGTELARGSLVIWCSWALNRSRLTWSDDAETFRPERWLTAAEATPSSQLQSPFRLVSRSPSEFPVFHGGPRTCLGKKMAESMAVQIMAAVVWFFDMQLAEEEDGDAHGHGHVAGRCKERVTKTSLTLPMEGGLPCHVRPRAASSSLSM